MIVKNKNITNVLSDEELIPLSEGGIVASEENLYSAVMYHTSHNDRLLRLLYYNYDDALNKERHKNIVNDDGTYVDEKLFEKEILNELLIFSKRLPTDNQDDKKSTYLTIDFGSRSISKDIGAVYVEFYIMVHQDLLILDDYKRRMAMIKIELMKMFDGVNGQFLGLLQYKSGGMVTVPYTYRCFKMTFEASDINRR